MRKRITRIGIIALAICLASALFTLPAHADVVWSEPNDFFELHIDECVEANQTFQLPAHRVISIKTSPGSQEEVDVWEGSYEIFENYGVRISHTYNHEGEIWGFLGTNNHGNNYSGWVLLEGATLAYTPNDFCREYQDSFYAYSGDTENITKHLESAEVVFWRWPCSGKIELARGYWGGMHFGSYIPDELQKIENYDLSQMYKDELGREWVYFDSPDQWGWICLDYPDSKDIPATISSFEPWSWDYESYPESGGASSFSLVLIIALVGFVVFASVALILLINRQKKRET